MQSGELPPPPASAALGMQIERVEVGVVAFSMQPQEWMYNPAGVVHGGLTATLLDTVLTLAVVSTLPAGRSAQTVNMSVHYVRPVLANGETIVAEAKTVHVGSSIATSEGRVHTAAGKLVAHGTATLALLDKAMMAARAAGR